MTEVIRRCGAVAHGPADISENGTLRFLAHCTVAVIAAGPHDDRDVTRPELIRALKTHGLHVIAYEDGAATWTVAARCRVLLAGCATLLDSASADFAAELERHVRQALRSSLAAAETESHLTATMSSLGIVGQSEAMLKVCRYLLRISPLSDLATLITGETGTGKELLARAIHSQDAKRSSGPFVALNCGAVLSSLAEDELFGHRRGAFTGADRDRKGLIRTADGGVLFLDEIGELGIAAQTKLLRVLQEGRVLPVGDERDVPVSVRMIAATNCDLHAMVEQRTFRADLFHRLNLLSIHVPPLRERRSDIPALAAHFARKHRALNPAASSAMSAEFVDALGRLDLPGNARELENLVRGAIVQNDGGGPLGLRDLPAVAWRQLATARDDAGGDSGSRSSERDSESDPAPAAPPGAGYPINLLDANHWNLARSLRACERSIVEVALRASHGNQSAAARLLGITPRSVYNKIRRHRLA